MSAPVSEDAVLREDAGLNQGSTLPARAPRRAGWQIALDVAVAPVTAFTNIRETPVWGWAFLISAVLGMVAAFAISPTIGHAMGLELPARIASTPQVAQMPAAQRDAFIAQQISIAQTVARFSFIFIPLGILLGSIVQALIMLGANAIGKGDGNFKRFWALAINGGIVGAGISSIALMIIVLIRGNDGFTTSSQIAGAVPGLGMFVPAGAKAAAAFFGAINVFTIWNMILLAIGMTIVGQIPRPVAIVTAALLLIATGIVPALGAILQK